MAYKYHIEEQLQELDTSLQKDLEKGGRENQLIQKQDKETNLQVYSNLNKILCFSISLSCIVIVAILVSQATNESFNINFISKCVSNKWQNVKDQIQLKEDDDANYELLTISKNNLKVLLITQKDLKLSSASLDVKVGSQNNPQEFQGLAHLFEHMLFMGSHKYPEEETFGRLVSQSGGEFNAYTSSGNTNYFFETTHNSLLNILDVWSRFFIDPLLSEDQISREVKAVDSEYMNTLTTEDARLYNLYVALSDEKNPFKIFSVGNTNTLTKNNTEIQKTYQALNAFRKKFYYSENMSLVIKADDSLKSDLKKKILECFKDVPTKKENYKNLTDFDEQLIYNPLQQTSQLPITKPIHSVLLEQNEIKKLVITYFIDSSSNDKYKSIEFARDLFDYGFEGINFCQHIEELRLGTKCKIEIDYEEENGTLSKFLIFSISLQLLDNQDKIEEIVKYYFYFMELVSTYPNKNEVYNKFKNIKQGLFNILDKPEQPEIPIIDVADYSNLLNQKKLKDIQSDKLVYISYNEEHFNSIINILTDPSKIIIIHKTSNSTFTEGKVVLQDTLNYLNYTKTEIPAEQYFQFKQYKNLNLPEIQFVKNFSEVSEKLLNETSTEFDNPEPKLILNSHQGRIYIQKDTYTFKKPVQTIYLQFENPILAQDVKSGAANLIVQQFIEKQINKRLHTLLLSGLQIKIEQIKNNGGFIIKVTCLDNQVDQIIIKVKEIIQKIQTDLIQDEQIFENYKTNVIENLYNFQNQMMFQQLDDLLSSYVYQNFYSNEQIIKVINDLRLEDIKQQVQSFYEQYFLTVYAFGNINEEQIRQGFNQLAAQLRTEEYQFSTKILTTRNKPTTLQLVFNQGDKVNGLCSNYYPIGKIDRKELTILNLIDNLMKIQSFSYLRTQLQLGYIADSKVSDEFDFQGVFVYVQGSNHNPNEYDKHIEEFLQLFEQTLDKLAQDDINSMKESLIEKLNNESFLKFNDKPDYYWQFISNKSYDYQRNKDIINILKSQEFSSQDLKDFFIKYFKNTNSRFSIQLFSPSKVNQTDLPIKPNDIQGYSGDLGTYVTSREEFNQQSYEYYTFEEQSQECIQ